MCHFNLARRVDADQVIMAAKLCGSRRLSGEHVIYEAPLASPMDEAAAYFPVVTGAAASALAVFASLPAIDHGMVGAWRGGKPALA